MRIEGNVMKLGQHVGTVLAALLACVVIALPASARFVEESIDLPVEISDSGGRNVRQSIRVVIYHDNEAREISLPDPKPRSLLRSR
jgi:hypothetical protein